MRPAAARSVLQKADKITRLKKALFFLPQAMYPRSLFTVSLLGEGSMLLRWRRLAVRRGMLQCWWEDKICVHSGKS